VLFVTSNFPRWEGDSTTPFVLHLAQDLQALGWHIRVLAPHAPGAARNEVLGGVQVERFRYLLPESLQTVCYQGGALLNLRRDRSNFAKLPALVGCELAALGRRLAGDAFDVVHSHWLLPQGFTAGIASRIFRVPHVATVHGGDVFALRSPWLVPFKRAAMRLADAVTVNSSATERVVRELVPAHRIIRRIPMGASAGVIAPQLATSELRMRLRRGAGPLLAFVGRVIEEKGVGDTLQAVAQLSAALPDVCAVIIGEGPDRSRFERLASDLGIADRVHFTGWVEPAAVAGYLQAADMFVGPSKRSPEGWVEAQGLVFVEAMLAGVPVVATATGGVGDLVVDGRTGLVVPESDPAAIAHAVIRLHRDPGLSRRLALQAGDHARGEFTREASAARFSDLYAQLLERH
jgi:glycosyltransferase involved in cell wall biosynthesis